MKNDGVKFIEKSITNLHDMNQLICKLFDLTGNYLDKTYDNKRGEYLDMLEKIKNLETKLFQDNYIEMLKGKVSVCLGFNFISIISIFVNISNNLKNIIDIINKEKTNIKNKSFEQVRDYILYIRHKNSIQSSSTSRNIFSIDCASINNVNTNEIINKSIN